MAEATQYSSLRSRLEKYRISAKAAKIMAKIMAASPIKAKASESIGGGGIMRRAAASCGRKHGVMKASAKIRKLGLE